MAYCQATGNSGDPNPSSLVPGHMDCGTIFSIWHIPGQAIHAALQLRRRGGQNTETLSPSHISSPGRDDLHPYDRDRNGDIVSLLSYTRGEDIPLRCRVQLGTNRHLQLTHIFLLIYPEKPSVSEEPKPSGVIRLQCQYIHIDTVQSAFSQRRIIRPVPKTEPRNIRERSISTAHQRPPMGRLFTCLHVEAGTTFYPSTRGNTGESLLLL